MRKDMKSVIVDRPRRKGSDRGYIKNTKVEDLPQREGIKDHLLKSDQKDFNDHITPMVRFLRSNVGRPWNKVYSEFCEWTDRREIKGHHAREHLNWLVELDCYKENRTIYDSKGMPIRGWIRFYVLNGLLHENKRKNKYCYKPKYFYWNLEQTGQYKQIDDIWYLFYLAPLEGYNNLLEIETGLPGDYRQKWGGDYYAYKKKQLNSKEIKQLKKLYPEFR